MQSSDHIALINEVDQGNAAVESLDESKQTGDENELMIRTLEKEIIHVKPNIRNACDLFSAVEECKENAVVELDYPKEHIERLFEHIKLTQSFLEDYVGLNYDINGISITRRTFLDQTYIGISLGEKMYEYAGRYEYDIWFTFPIIERRINITLCPGTQQQSYSWKYVVDDSDELKTQRISSMQIKNNQNSLDIPACELHSHLQVVAVNTLKNNPVVFENLHIDNMQKKSPGVIMANFVTICGVHNTYGINNLAISNDWKDVAYTQISNIAHKLGIAILLKSIISFDELRFVCVLGYEEFMSKRIIKTLDNFIRNETIRLKTQKNQQPK